MYIHFVDKNDKRSPSRKLQNLADKQYWYFVICIGYLFTSDLNAFSKLHSLELNSERIAVGLLWGLVGVGAST